MIDEQNPFVLSASALGYNDDHLFDKALDALFANGLENATPQEKALLIGIAAGTIRRLRDQLAKLEDKQNAADEQL